MKNVVLTVKIILSYC